jgi:hypothetical protein
MRESDELSSHLVPIYFPIMSGIDQIRSGLQCRVNLVSKELPHAHTF